MSALSDYLECGFLNHLLRNTQCPQANTLYVALFNSNPGDSGTSGEVATGSYARVAVTNDTSKFPPCPVVGNTVKTNGEQIVFPTASAAWGTVTHWAIYNASTSGDMLVHGSLVQSRYVSAGDTPRIAAGGITISATNSAQGGLTAFAKRQLLDRVFGKQNYAPPATVYIGLGTAISGESITEWDGTGYSRSATEFDSATSGGGYSANTNEERFCESVDSGDAGEILTHWGLWDDSSSGNLLACGPLSISRTVSTGDAVKASAGSVVITLD